MLRLTFTATLVLAVAICSLVSASVSVTGPSCSSSKYQYKKENETTLFDVNAGKFVFSSATTKYSLSPCPTAVTSSTNKISYSYQTDSYSASANLACSGGVCSVSLSMTGFAEVKLAQFEKGNQYTGSATISEAMSTLAAKLAAVEVAHGTLKSSVQSAESGFGTLLKSLKIRDASDFEAAFVSSARLRQSLATSSHRVYESFGEMFMAKREYELLATPAVTNYPDVSMSSVGERMALDVSFSMSINTATSAVSSNGFSGSARAYAYEVSFGTMQLFEYTPTSGSAAFDPDQATSSYTAYAMTKAANPAGVITVANHNTTVGNGFGSRKFTVNSVVAGKGTFSTDVFISPADATASGQPTLTAHNVKVAFRTTSWTYANAANQMAVMIAIIGRSAEVHFQLSSLDTTGSTSVTYLPAATFTKTSATTVQSELGKIEFEGTVTNGGNSYTMEFGSVSACTQGICPVIKSESQAVVYQAFFSVRQANLANWLWDPQASSAVPASVPPPQSTQSSAAMSSKGVSMSVVTFVAFVMVAWFTSM